MSIPIVFSIKTAGCALAACLGFQAFAADAVTDAMQEAYAPYRQALFKTNGKSQVESQQAVTQAQLAWSGLTSRFAGKPTVPYDRDPAFAASLAEVAAVYAKASAEVGASQLGAAHETLEKARDVMADMRRRNQVVVYSDHMNAYHAEMEHMLDHAGKILSQPNGLLQLTAKVGAMQYLARKLAVEAPASHSGNEEFTGLVRAVEKSVVDLQAALFAQDPAAVKEALGKLKPPYSRLFLKFG